MSDAALLRRLLRQVRPYWGHLGALFALGLLASPIALLVPVPLKIVVDSVIGGPPLPSFLLPIIPTALTTSPGAVLAVAVGLLVLVAALNQLQALANKYWQTHVGQQLVLGLRAQLVQQAQRLSLSYHDTKGTADSLYRIQQDAAMIDTIMVEGIIPFVAAAITLATMIVVTMRLDWQLALVALAVSPPLLLLSSVYRPRMRRQSRRLKKRESSALSVVQETLGALRVVKAFGQEARGRRRSSACSPGSTTPRGGRSCWTESICAITASPTCAASSRSSSRNRSSFPSALPRTSPMRSPMRAPRASSRRPRRPTPTTSSSGSPKDTRHRSVSAA